MTQPVLLQSYEDEFDLPNESYKTPAEPKKVLSKVEDGQELDAEIERAYAAIHPQTEEELEWEWELQDNHPDGTELGWTLSFRYKNMDRDQTQ